MNDSTAKKNNFGHELAGRVFGDLTVISMSETRHSSGGRWWNCRCSCGALCEVPGTLLVNGRKTHCGCKTYRGSPKDISARRFGRLVAMNPTGERSGAGNVVWLCRCDCGNEVKLSYNDLVHSAVTSCGCKKKELDEHLGELQTRIDGTSLDIIKSRKLPKDNTTGVKGVYLVKGRYLAKIMFRGKRYYLGKFASFERAKEARLKAEEILYGSTLDYYGGYKKRADADPEWARENPMQIFVEQKDGGFDITFSPVL